YRVTVPGWNQKWKASGLEVVSFKGGLWTELQVRKAWADAWLDMNNKNGNHALIQSRVLVFGLTPEDAAAEVREYEQQGHRCGTEALEPAAAADDRDADKVVHPDPRLQDVGRVLNRWGRPMVYGATLSK